jgi:hypothetical protein
MPRDYWELEKNENRKEKKGAKSNPGFAVFK